MMRAAVCLAIGVLMLPCVAFGATRDELLGDAADLGRQGRYAEGLDMVREMVAADPRDVEARMLEARLLAWAGRNGEAETAIAAILAAQPGNSDALALAGAIAWYRGDVAAARARYEAAVAISPSDQEAQLGLARAVAALSAGQEWAWRVDMGVDFTRSGGGSQKDWQEGFMRVGRKLSAATQVHLFAQHSHRFGEVDRFLEIGAEHSVAPWLRGSVAIGGTVAADFLPRRRIDAGGAVRVAADPGLLTATWLTVDARHADYRSGTVAHVAPGVQQYLFDGRVWVTGRFLMMKNEFDKHPTGWEMRVDWQAWDKVRLFAGYADVPETTDNVTLPSTSRLIGAVFGIADDMDITLSASRQDPKRETIGAALSVRF
jgi:YaiO family outer membrane protein